MKFRILLLMLLVVSCAPVSDPTRAPNGLPPDTTVTGPPAGDLPTKGTPTNPFSPKPGDEKLSRSGVFIDETSLVIRESYPPQISLSITGNLPTPCHALRAEIASPDQQKRIMVDVYSVVDPGMACAEVLKPFQEFIDLGTFPSGHYSVWVNGELAGEFDS